VLPVVNISQKFMLKEIVKDFAVTVDLIFFCESGKININGLYDLANKKFYNEGIEGKDCKVFATWLFDKIATLTEKPSLLQPFIEHVKQRKSPFNDVTELLAIKEFATCFQGAVFYAPALQNSGAVPTRAKIFLTDIFTVCSENDTIQPWLLSAGLCALLDIPEKKSQQDKAENKEKDIDLSAFKVQANWQQDWDKMLKPLYTIAYDKVPKVVQPFLATQFEVTTFSVLATIRRDVGDEQNDMMTRIFAILKERKLSDNSIMYDVIKIYQV
jgi:hypothetical protein